MPRARSTPATDRRPSLGRDLNPAMSLDVGQLLVLVEELHGRWEGSREEVLCTACGADVDAEDRSAQLHHEQDCWNRSPDELLAAHLVLTEDRSASDWLTLLAICLEGWWQATDCEAAR